MGGWLCLYRGPFATYARLAMAPGASFVQINNGLPYPPPFAVGRPGRRGASRANSYPFTHVAGGGLLRFCLLLRVFSGGLPAQDSFTLAPARTLCFFMFY